MTGRLKPAPTSPAPGGNSYSVLPPLPCRSRQKWPLTCSRNANGGSMQLLEVSAMRMISKVVPLVVLLSLVLAVPADAQYFGRNKVQWENFEFKTLRTEHFDIYYYDREEDVVQDIGRMAERWYTRLSRVFNHSFTRKPIVLYANSA